MAGNEIYSKLNKLFRSLSPKRYTNIDLILYSAIILGCTLRFFLALYTPLNGSTVKYLYFARLIGQGKVSILMFGFENLPIFKESILMSMPPLFQIVGGLFYNIGTIFNLGDPALKLVSPFFGVILVFIAYIFGSYKSKRIGLYSAFIVTYLPRDIIVSIRPLQNTIYAVVFSISIYFFLKPVIDNEKKHYKKYFVISGFFLGLTLLSKRQGLLLIPILIIYSYTFKRREIINLLNILSVFSIGMLVSLPMFVRNYIVSGNLIAGKFVMEGKSITGSKDPTNFSPIKPKYYFDGFFEFWGIPEGNFDPVYALVQNQSEPIQWVFILWLGIIAILSLIFVYVISHYVIEYKKGKLDLFEQGLIIWIIISFSFEVYLFFFMDGALPKYRHILHVSVPLGILLANYAVKIEDIKISYVNGRTIIYSLFIILFLLSMVAIPRSIYLSENIGKYNGGIEWVNSNTNPGDKIITNNLNWKTSYHTQTYNYPSKSPEAFSNLIKKDKIKYIVIYLNAGSYHSKKKSQLIIENVTQKHLSQEKIVPVYNDKHTQIYKPK